MFFASRFSIKMTVMRSHVHQTLILINKILIIMNWKIPDAKLALMVVHPIVVIDGRAAQFILTLLRSIRKEEKSKSSLKKTLGQGSIVRIFLIVFFLIRSTFSRKNRVHLRQISKFCKFK